MSENVVCEDCATENCEIRGINKPMPCKSFTKKRKKLERVALDEAPFTSAAMVVDREIKDKSNGITVGFVVYSDGGNIVIMLHDGYDPVELLTAGEKYLGETFRSTRFKAYRAETAP